MLLERISVAGFKSLKTQEFTLGRVNVFIGQNGAGKSNVLEALGMLSAAISGSVTYESLSNRGVRLSAPSVYRSALARWVRPKTFALAAQFESLRYEANIYSTDSSQVGATAWPFHSESLQRKLGNGSWKKIAGRSPRGATINGKAFDKTKLKRTDSIVQAVELIGDLTVAEDAAIKTLRDFAIFAPSTGVLRGVESSLAVRTPLSLTGSGLPAALREIIKGADRHSSREFRRIFTMLNWCTSVGVEQANPELKFRLQGGGKLDLAFRDRFMHVDFNKLYSADVSEGALYVAFILALLLHDKTPKMFALDNVDSTLNPGLVKNVIENISELAKSADRQVILTTHNPTALDGLDIFDPNHRLYVVDRNSFGATELTRLSAPDGYDREKWNAAFGGAKLSELWIDGLLGGLTPPIAL